MDRWYVGWATHRPITNVKAKVGADAVFFNFFGLPGTFAKSSPRRDRRR
jgi:hypothetical protein